MNESDIIGNKYNHLEVIKRGEDYIAPSGKRLKRWLCLCDCQLESPKEEQKLNLVYQSHLLNNKVKSCGCNKYRIHPNYKDWTGHKFGKLTVEGRVEKPSHMKNQGVYWECKCSCGNKTIMISAEIKRERMLSCGKCSRNEFELFDNYGIGTTTKGDVFYFDIEDFEKIKNYA